MTDKIPDGIIRAYRKAIRAQEHVNLSTNTDSLYQWLEGVKWELAQLYPDLNKLPKVKTNKKAWVVYGYNGLLKASGAIAVAFTKEAAEVAAKDTEWICDNQRIEEVSVWE